MTQKNKISHDGINKGVELMLRRRAKTKPLRSGIKISKTIALFRKVFYFKLELTWEESNQP